MTSLTLGEASLNYHIRVRSIRKPSKQVDLKSVALIVAPAAAALVQFSHVTPLEWICSVSTSVTQPGASNVGVVVDPTASGSSNLQALELVISDPFGVTTETVQLDLPLTVA
ncbi:MAG TPA: hypothetical protein VGG57_02165 [Stellaceae bacterium]